MPNPLCFILMSFGKKPDRARKLVDFDAVCSDLIAPAIEHAGLEPRRAGEEVGGGIIHKPMFERLIEPAKVAAKRSRRSGRSKTPCWPGPHERRRHSGGDASMCGRYTITRPADLLEELGIETTEPLQASYNVAPTQKVPVVRAAPGAEAEAGSAAREAVNLRWGLIPFWAKDIKIGNRMINARSETVATKPAFRSSLRRKRCAVLADGFYEWRKTEDGKQPYLIHLEDRRPFLFAGLWDRWDKGPIDPIESFTILTTRPNDKVAELHNRMPVILTPEALEMWLDPSIDDGSRLTKLLGPCDAEEIDFHPVSKMVNRPSNNLPQCLEPIEL